MDTLFIFGAKYLFLFSPLVAGIFFLKQARRTQINMIILALAAVPLTYVIVFILNHVYFDPRPFVEGHFTPLVPHDSDNGFPSDHTVLTTLIASIVWFFNRRVSLCLFVIAALVAISRVSAGIHHPIDVIGGALISIIMTTIGYFLVRKYTHERTS